MTLLPNLANVCQKICNLAFRRKLMYICSFQHDHALAAFFILPYFSKMYMVRGLELRLPVLGLAGRLPGEVSLLRAEREVAAQRPVGEQQRRRDLRRKPRLRKIKLLLVV